MTKIISIINQKGGVGKTTTAINLAYFLSKMNFSVGLVDFDPQGNATSGLGITKDQIDKTIFDVILDGVAVDQIKISTKGLNVYPADQDLAGAEQQLSSRISREYTLRNSLKSCMEDFVLIDCPPSLGLLTINALTASDYIIVPVQTEYYALEGLSQLINVFQLVKDGLNPNLTLLGILMTMYDSRTSLSEQVKNELIKHFSSLVFKTVVPRNIRLAEAPSHGKTIAEHDKWSKGAKAYKMLAKEVKNRV